MRVPEEHRSEQKQKWTHPGRTVWLVPLVPRWGNWPGRLARAWFCSTCTRSNICRTEKDSKHVSLAEENTPTNLLDSFHVEVEPLRFPDTLTYANRTFCLINSNAWENGVPQGFLRWHGTLGGVLLLEHTQRILSSALNGWQKLSSLAKKKKSVVG